VRQIKLNKHIKFFLKLSVTVAALYFVFRRIDISEVWALYKQINPLWIIPAILLFIGSKVFSAFRLNGFFRCTGLQLSDRANLRLYLLGMFYNLFLPGGIGGDGYKIYMLNRKEKIKVKDLLFSILLDRISGSFAILLLVILLFYFVPVNISFNYKAFLWLLIPISVGIYYLVISRFFKQFVPVFLLSNGQSLAVQVLQVLSVFFILKALGQTGQELSYILLFLVSSVIAGLPITVGGVGAREMTFLLGAGILGLDTGLSVAVSLMFYLVTASISLCGSYFTFRPGRLALSK
jgi:uncharacterized membrane protein YbhN (UPF0104 family)